MDRDVLDSRRDKLPMLKRKEESVARKMRGCCRHTCVLRVKLFSFFFFFFIIVTFLRVSNTHVICRSLCPPRRERELFALYRFIPGNKMDERVTNPNDGAFLSVLSR